MKRMGQALDRKVFCRLAVRSSSWWTIRFLVLPVGHWPDDKQTDAYLPDPTGNREQES